MSRGTASKTCVAQRTFSHRPGSGLPCSKHNIVPSCTTTLLTGIRTSMEGSCAQLTPLGSTRCQRVREQLCSLLGCQTATLLARRLVSTLAMVRAECDVAPAQNATRWTATEQKRSRIRKVATPARAGEKGRALAAARNAPPVPVTESKLFKKSRVSTKQTQNLPLPHRLLCQTYSCQKLPS